MTDNIYAYDNTKFIVHEHVYAILYIKIRYQDLWKLCNIYGVDGGIHSKNGGITISCAKFPTISRVPKLIRPYTRRRRKCSNKIGYTKIVEMPILFFGYIHG